MVNNIFKSFFTEIFVYKFFSKIFNKNVGENTIKYIYLIVFLRKFKFLLAFIN